MQCQRARICRAANEAEQVRLTHPALLGKELWVKMEAPRLTDFLCDDGSTIPQVLIFRVPYYAKNIEQSDVVPADCIELLARGLEDFCEITTYIPWQQWRAENGIA